MSGRDSRECVARLQDIFTLMMFKRIASRNANISFSLQRLLRTSRGLSFFIHTSAQQSRFIASLVHGHSSTRFQYRRELVRYLPHVFFSRHAVRAIESCQVHRRWECAERLFASRIVVMRGVG